MPHTSNNSYNVFLLKWVYTTQLWTALHDAEAESTGAGYQTLRKVLPFQYAPRTMPRTSNNSYNVFLLEWVHTTQLLTVFHDAEARLTGAGYQTLRKVLPLRYVPHTMPRTSNNSYNAFLLE